MSVNTETVSRAQLNKHCREDKKGVTGLKSATARSVVQSSEILWTENMGDKECQTVCYEEAWLEVLVGFKEELKAEAKSVLDELSTELKEEVKNEAKEVTNTINQELKANLEKTKNAIKNLPVAVNRSSRCSNKAGSNYPRM